MPMIRHYFVFVVLQFWLKENTGSVPFSRALGAHEYAIDLESISEKGHITSKGAASAKKFLNMWIPYIVSTANATAAVAESSKSKRHLNELRCANHGL